MNSVPKKKIATRKWGRGGGRAEAGRSEAERRSEVFRNVARCTNHDSPAESIRDVAAALLRVFEVVECPRLTQNTKFTLHHIKGGTPCNHCSDVANIKATPHIILPMPHSHAGCLHKIQ